MSEKHEDRDFSIMYELHCNLLLELSLREIVNLANHNVIYKGSVVLGTGVSIHNLFHYVLKKKDKSFAQYRQSVIWCLDQVQDYEKFLSYTNVSVPFGLSRLAEIEDDLIEKFKEARKIKKISEERVN